MRKRHWGDDAKAGRPAVNAEFFVLAFAAALNPKLLAIDLLLTENRRPRAMFLCLLAGGMITAVAIGLIEVFVAHPSSTKTQKSASAALDLALGVVLVAVGVLLATGRLSGRQRDAAARRKPKNNSKPWAGWAQRALGQPRPGLAVVVGVLIGLPGISYLDTLHNLTIGQSPVATQVVAVVVFVVIEFLLLIVPFAFLELRPEATKARLNKTQDWLLGHAKQLMVAVALVLGAYLTISGLVRLS